MKVLIESVKEPGRTKLVSERDARILIALGRWKNLGHATEVTAPRAPGRRAGVSDELADVAFASDVAHEAARAAGLTAASFAGRTGSGKEGAFTKADVLAIVADHA